MHVALGVLSDDKEWNESFTEVRHWETGFQLGELFVTLLLFLRSNNCQTIIEEELVIVVRWHSTTKAGYFSI